MTPDMLKRRPHTAMDFGDCTYDPRVSNDPRFVGDPIDVVSGAVTDSPTDMVVRGPLPLRWVRYYSSARRGIHGALGWGQSHEFERCLRRDVDGIRYEGPTGEVVGFPELDVGGRCANRGIGLCRTSEFDYTLTKVGFADQIYQFLPGVHRAPLIRMELFGDTIEFKYGSRAELVSFVDSRERTVQVGYDAAGHVVSLSTIDPQDSRKTQVLLAYSYDDAGQLIQATDLYQTTLSFSYDRRGRMTRRTDRNGYSFHFSYDDQDRCIHSKGEDGLLEVFLEYSPETQSTAVRRGDGGKWTYFYNASGAITQVCDPYGSATRYIHDEQGRPVQEIDPKGNVTVLHYNRDGHHDYRVDANGTMIPAGVRTDPPDPMAYQLPTTPLQWEFGALPRILAAIRADSVKEETVESEYTDNAGFPLLRVGKNFTERWRYDGNGNLVEYRDRDGGVWKAEYRSWNTLRKTADPLGNVTRYEHNTQGLVSKIVDAGETVTEYKYDLRDKLIEVRTQGQLREKYQRDAAGNIVAKLDSHGRTLVRWEIGPGNVSTSRILRSGELHKFQMDKRGRIVSAVAPSGTATFAYAEDGFICKDLRDGLGVVHSFQSGLLHNSIYLNSFKVSYEFDPSGDWMVTDPMGGQHRFRVSSTRSVTKTLANGVTEACEFDGDGRCIGKSLTRPESGRAWTRTYEYSHAGDLVLSRDSELGSTRYVHDAAHRLIEEHAEGATARRFAHDPAGNLIVQPGLKSTQVGTCNRLVTANGEDLQYNDRDHLCGRKGPESVSSYQYNELDLLVQCELNGARWTAEYDVFCRRVRKTWQGHTTEYYWDDFRLAAEIRSNGSVRLYLYADISAQVPFMFVEFASIDAEPHTGKPYYIYTNQIGAPIRATNAVGDTCWQARLSPYGVADIDPKSSIELVLRFPGHFCDSETGLHYNRFRYYDPILGRYLQVDPLGQAGGINLYGYPVSPLVDVDLDGLTRTVVGRNPLRTRTGPVASPGNDAHARCPSPIPPGGINPEDMVRDGVLKVQGPPELRAGIMRDLRMIAGTPTGQRVLKQLKLNHTKYKSVVDIRANRPACAIPMGPGGANLRDPSTGKNGHPVNTNVQYMPGDNLSDKVYSPSDVVLLHELDHAGRQGSGNSMDDYPNPDPARFPNAEEEAAVRTENEYRGDSNRPARVNENGEEDYFCV